MVLCSAHPVCSQTASQKKSPFLTQGTPQNAGMSAQRLEIISEVLQEAVASDAIPGAVALVARNGKIVYHQAFGTADPETGQAYRKDDIFRIASQSKAITATAVMMLWEEGKFQLDDPIDKFIPEFKNPRILKDFRYADTTYTTVEVSKPITIRHLLTHTSGLGYGEIDGDDRMKMIYQKAGITDLFTSENISIAESVKKLAALPLHHEPGEKYTYSEGLDVLGYLVEIVSGQPFDVFLKERLFTPLGMKDTGFYLPEEKANRLVPVQTKKDGEWIRYPVTFYDPDYPISGAKRFFSGGAGLVSTVSDYAAFLQMYLNKGELNGTRILSRTTIDMMMADQVNGLWGNPGNAHYGLAFGVVTDKGQALGGKGSKGTFDWGGYFNTSYFADPEEQVIGILFKQTRSIPGEATSWKFRQIIGASIDD